MLFRHITAGTARDGTAAVKPINRVRAIRNATATMWRGKVRMAGRPSVVLREQFEAAKRHAEAHGSLALIVEVRTNVDVAIGVVRERLNAVRGSKAPETGTSSDSLSSAASAEELSLKDELAELRRLRDHLKFLMGAIER